MEPIKKSNSNWDHATTDSATTSSSTSSSSSGSSEISALIASMSSAAISQSQSASTTTTSSSLAPITTTSSMASQSVSAVTSISSATLSSSSASSLSSSSVSRIIESENKMLHDQVSGTCYTVCKAEVSEDNSVKVSIELPSSQIIDFSLLELSFLSGQVRIASEYESEYQHIIFEHPVLQKYFIKIYLKAKNLLEPSHVKSFEQMQQDEVKLKLSTGPNIIGFEHEGGNITVMVKHADSTYSKFDLLTPEDSLCFLPPIEVNGIKAQNSIFLPPPIDFFPSLPGVEVATNLNTNSPNIVDDIGANQADGLFKVKISIVAKENDNHEIELNFKYTIKEEGIDLFQGVLEQHRKFGVQLLKTYLEKKGLMRQGQTLLPTLKELNKKPIGSLLARVSPQANLFFYVKGSSSIKRFNAGRFS